MITTTQQNQALAYLIMTTIASASFFSGVMTTTLQLAFNQATAVIDNIVNVLLLSSLILSISSAVNSRLIMSWKRSFIYSMWSILSVKDEH